MRDLSDDALLTLAQEKNQAAFEELMRRNSSTSFKLALSILKDRQDAEDEVQNSYWNAWRHLAQFRRGSKFSTWMSRIVINHCLMRLRKTRRANFFYLDEGAADGEVPVVELRDKRPTPEGDLGSRETSEILHREIRSLPLLLRKALVMRDLDEMSMEELAAELGISVMAAKSRLLRARKELRRRLEQRGEIVPVVT
jgi:RNA polymerase sigma-70 factor (ECF subfamily)